MLLPLFLLRCLGEAEGARKAANRATNCSGETAAAPLPCPSPSPSPRPVREGADLDTACCIDAIQFRRACSVRVDLPMRNLVGWLKERGSGSCIYTIEPLEEWLSCR